jgi:hypothetical protein
MANVKISALPSYTGSAADLRWFVMNNSGETETFKFSGYTSPYKTGAGTDSVVNNSNSPSLASGTNSFVSVQSPGSINAGESSWIFGKELSVSTATQSMVFGRAHNVISPYRSVVLGGNNNYLDQGNSNVLIGGQDNQGQSSPQFSSIVGGYQNSIGGGSFNSVIGGSSNQIPNGSNNFIGGGTSNIISSSGNYNFIGGGQGNTLGANTIQTSLTAGYNNNIQATILGFIGGTQDNTITSAGYTYVLVGGGYNTINATNASAGNAMYSSYFCTDNTINDSSVIGSSNNWFSGSRNGNMSGYGKHNWITNSYSSTILNNPSSDVYEWFNKIDSSSGSSINYSRQSQILGGVDNTIDQVANSVILGGSGNTINGELPNVEKFNMILGGSGNTISDAADDQKLQTIINSVNTTLTNGVDRVTAIGLSGRTINDAGSGTTYVENLKAFRQITSGFYDNGSIPQAGYTINLNNGDKQQITITGSAGNTNLYFIGNLAGGRLVLKVINTSTGDLGFADAAPYNWKIPVVYPSASPSATDVYIFESFGDQSLWFASQSKNLS